MRKFLIGLGVVVGLLVVAALVAPGLVDWNRYKGEIAARVEAATGRDLVIAGDLDLSLLPVLRLSAGDVRLANIPGGSSPDMARIKALDIQVRLLPLLQGRFEAEAITLVEPEIVLERLADGRANWQFAPRAGGETARAPDAAGPQRGAGAQAVRLDNLRIRRGTVIWRDAASGTEEKIAGVSLQLAARSLEGPFQAKGEMILRGVPLAVEAAVGALQPRQAAPVSVVVTVPSADTRAELTGSAVLAGAAPRFTGKLNAGGKDLRRLAAALAGTSRTTLPDALAKPFLLRGQIKASETGGTVDALEAELGGARATGTVSVTAGERLKSAVKLHVTRIDLDPWLAASAPPPAGGGPAGAAGGGAGGQAAAPAPFALPDIDATLEARIEAVTYRRQNIRDIALRAALAGGTARLERLAALLPGGGEAAASGTLAARDGRPLYDGRVDVQSDNLRAMLGWLGADVAAVPSDRLRKFAFSAAVKGDDAELQLLGAKLSVDTTRIDGGVTIALRARPAFGATVTFDSLDLDAYLPRAGASQVSAVGAAKPKPGGGSAAGGGGAAPRGPLAMLDDFDANLLLRVNRLTAGATTARDIRFDGTLVGGTMTVRNASVGDIGGARVALAGTVGNFAAVPVFKGTVAADARDSADLLRLAGLSPPSGPLGPLKLRGTADASAGRVALDLALDAAGGSVKLAGTASGLDGAPRIDATLAAAHPDTARLLAVLGMDPPAGKLGPLDASAQLKGTLQQLSLTSRVAAAGGTVTATGTAKDLAAEPAWNLVLAAAHPSVGDLGRRFAPDWRPAGGAIGPLRVDATVAGGRSGWTLSALTASAGKVTLQGSGKLATDGARPKLTAALTAGEIDLNPFLPAEKAAARPAGGKPGVGPGGGQADGRAAAERFSAEPFDLSGLETFDADVTVGATALVWRQFRIDRPQIAGTLANGLLTVKEIAGRLFDGGFRLAGTLDARATPAVAGTVAVEGANIGKAVLEAGAFDLEGGIADFTMQVAGAGTSPRAMVGALNGTGKLSARDGVVKGFDLKAVSDRLKDIDKPVDILSLLGTSLQGGQTRFSSLDGTFRIEKGVLRSDDLRLVAEAGELRAAGFADLPRWHMDFNGEVRLTEHPKAPPFGMRAVGPIDDPRRIFRFEKLQEFLLQRGIGTMLRKVLPREDRPATQQPPAQQPQQPQPQQPRKPRLEDLLPGILDSLKR